MFFLTLAQSTSFNFLIQLLEAGGLPALTIGVLMTVFIILWKLNSKGQAKRDEDTASAFKQLQQEREDSSQREHEQYLELMKSYEEIVNQLVELSKESTWAITRLSERVSQCPLRDSLPIVPIDGEHDGNES